MILTMNNKLKKLYDISCGVAPHTQPPTMSPNAVAQKRSLVLDKCFLKVSTN